MAATKTKRDKKLYKRLRERGVRKNVAKKLADSLPRQGKAKTKPARRAADELSAAVDEIKDRVSRGPRKRSKAAKKGAATRKRNAQARSRSAKKGARSALGGSARSDYARLAGEGTRQIECWCSPSATRPRRFVTRRSSSSRRSRARRARSPGDPSP